jgi:hypothetical protein
LVKFKFVPANPRLIIAHNTEANLYLCKI